ncbi:MAG: hypothetical protein WD906_06140 [Anaerolineales bacterium]
METTVATETAVPTQTAPPEPSITPTPAILDLAIVEWSEWPYANLADPSNTDTHVEALIRNPNDFPVRIDQNAVELRFVNSEGEVVFSNENPFLYIWEGSWMLPGETAALSVCVCFWSSGLPRQNWESLELTAPLQVAEGLAYTLEVEVTIGEFSSLFGGGDQAAEMTLTNTSDAVLESIPMRVLARDAGGRYVGVVTFGDAVVSFLENISIQPGATGHGIVVSDIDYYTGPLTTEVSALGILAGP